MKMNTIYVNNNGVIIPSKGASIASGNRSYLYGDGLFETVRIIDGKVINTEHHFNRLIQGVKALKMNIPFHFTIDFMIEKIEDLFNQMIQMCQVLFHIPEHQMQKQT